MLLDIYIPPFRLCAHWSGGSAGVSILKSINVKIVVQAPPYYPTSLVFIVLSIFYQFDCNVGLEGKVRHHRCIQF